MAALVIPAKSRLAIARREPNLLVPGRQPLAGVRLRQEWIAKGLARVISPIPGYSLSVGVSGVVTTDADGRGYAAVAGGYWRTDEQNIVSGSDEFTIVAAFKSAAGIENGGRSLYVERPNATQIVKLGIVDTNFQTHLVVRNGSGAIMFAASAANHNDGVMHVAAGVRYASNDHKLFVDGVLAGSSTDTIVNSFPSASYGYVANDPVAPTTSFVTGSIPLVALFTKALSADDVTRLSRDYYAELFQPANQSPFLISIPGGGGAETINADFISSVTSVYEPTLTTGAVTISVDFVSAATSVYEPTVSAPSGTQDVTADFISSATSVYEPTVTTGAVTVTADFIAASTSVHESTLTVGAVTITADFVSAATSVYEPTVFSGSAIIPDFIAAATSVYEPTVTTGAVTIAADLIAAGTIVYEPSVSSAVNISADFIAAATSVHEAIVGVGAVTILADFISSGTIVYEPSIPFGQIISADFIAALSAVYEPSVTDAAAIWTEITPVSTIWTEI